MTATAKKITRCACSTFEFGEFDGGNESAVTYGTGCVETTSRTFAMGHDAKLIGYMVRAEMAGEEIARTDGGMLHLFAGAVRAAGSISDALAIKAQAQLDAGKARLAKKASKAAEKAAKKSAKKAEAPAPAKREATIKIGRWTYDATIDPTGIALYNTKKGEAKSAKPGEYTEI